MKKILVFNILTIFALVSYGQLCCNVVDGSGVNVISSNGLCLVAPNSSGGSIFCATDMDGDGVLDDEDKCPEVAGLTEFSGCLPPDADSDGVIDSEDKCPNVSGTVNGCPDSDGDGVIDMEDKCPDVAGTINGCPDSDGDSVIDSMDECPNTAGLTNLKGCPDSDSDGIADKDDSCPNEAGIAANEGCPELNDDEKDILKAALEGVNFLSGKDVLTKDSKPKLDNVAEVLLAHSTYKLKISGYTDSSGGEESNLALSKERAAAVKEYLIGDGVAADRILADGFGEADPIADNSTAAGRAKNRRVEFKIIFH